MEKKYQVFISSTYTDLVEARMKVRDAILSMYHFPVGMELFGAANEEQWQIISETIDSSDYYVLIVGQRYGSIIPEGQPDAGISYTEKEFRYALEKGVPILAFIIDDAVLVKPENIEKDHPEKLESFKETVKSHRLVEWWNNPDELAQKVTVALYKQITRTKRPGWIRGDTVDIEKSLKTITQLIERNQLLSDENKVLLLENQALKQKSEKKPKLTITIEGENPEGRDKNDPLYARNGNISSEKNGDIYLKVGSVNTNNVEAEYLPVSKSDFFGELRGKITDEEIKAYNDALPSNEVMQVFLESYRAYHMIIDHGIASKVSICNSGTGKATDVSVTIDFPDEILIFDISTVRKLSEPVAPKKPRNLQEIAYERAHKSEIAIVNTISKFGQLGGLQLPRISDISAISVGNSIYETVDVLDNTVNIETRRGIVHTRSDCFYGIYIVPLKKGTYIAKATIMCAEYDEPELMEITFICK